jgi:hypothetical protein
VCERENDSGLQRWGRGEREQEWEGRRREREGAGGDARTVRKIEHMRRNVREKEKGMGRNMERRRQGDG